MTSKEMRGKVRERHDIVTMEGNPLTLLGDEVKVGKQAPDFVAIDNELKPVRL